MNEVVEKLNNEPLLMLSSAIGVVLVLFVVLTVVIATMRIRTYKNRFVNTRMDNDEKEKTITELRQEVQMLQSLNERKSHELEQFDTVKLRLQETELALKETQDTLAKLDKLQGQTQTKLENSEQMYAALKDEHEALKERLEVLSEENNKLRVSNARLLIKLDTEEQFASQLQQRDGKPHGDEES
jgi:DNA repair exonuclease SbcCD ATPase subunit